ncbi:MAG: hypothetical protein AAFU64_06565 [Bacteroidota bacterium]
MNNQQLISFLEDQAVKDLGSALQFLGQWLKANAKTQGEWQSIYLKVRQLEGNYQQIETEKANQTSSQDQIRAGLNQTRLSFLKMLPDLGEMEALEVVIPDLNPDKPPKSGIEESPRVKTLLEHLTRSFKIIGEYESQLMLSDDPKQKARAEIGMEEQHKFINRFARELAEIRGEVFDNTFLNNLKQALGY